MKDFKKYDVWILGMNLVEDVYQAISAFPKVEDYGLRSQITRAVVSIPANIAEGASRESQKDFKRFLEISLGSSFELDTLLLIVKKRNWIEESLIDNIVKKNNQNQVKLGALIKVIKKNL